jgi:hypothetical protein
MAHSPFQAMCKFWWVKKGAASVSGFCSGQCSSLEGQGDAHWKRLVWVLGKCPTNQGPWAQAAIQNGDLSFLMATSSEGLTWNFQIAQNILYRKTQTPYRQSKNFLMSLLLPFFSLVSRLSQVCTRKNQCFVIKPNQMSSITPCPEH